MLTRKIIDIAFITILTSLTLLPCSTHKIANAADEKYQGLIGEWSAVWPGNRGDRSTIVVHEVDEAKSKARITYIVDRADEGHKEYEIDADFFPIAHLFEKISVDVFSFRRNSLYRRHMKHLIFFFSF